MRATSRLDTKVVAWQSWQEILRMDHEQTNWQALDATDLDSSTGLNHPTKLADKSILVLGHRTTKGDVVVTAEPNIERRHRSSARSLTPRRSTIPRSWPQLPGNLGRSRELIVETQSPGSDKWEKQKLKIATADFSEPEHPIEQEWTHKGLRQRKQRAPSVQSPFSSTAKTKPAGVPTAA